MSKRNNFYKRFFKKALLLFTVLTFLHSGSVEAKPNYKYASIVVNAATGKVLSERHADKRLYPASLTKIMTIYLTLDALKSGRLKKWQRLPVSKHAASMVPSKLGLKPGNKIRVDDAISALVTKSANDVAVVLAEAIAGSEARFAIMMTKKARTLGMKRTTFKNASGLHNKRQVSTARDMAVLARSFLLYHPNEYKKFSMKSFTYAGKTYRNHNKLMSTYKGMDGIKTGYVRASGFNLVASAMRNGQRLVGVVFGGRSGNSRNRHMASLLDKGFAKAQRYQLAKWQNTPPKPARKPVIARIEVASNETKIQNKLASIPLHPSHRSNQHFDMLGLVVGEGDIDMDTIESLKAMSKTTAGLRTKISIQENNNKENWQIQIGAFTTLTAAHKALNKTAKTLKYNNNDQNIVPRVFPLKTGRGIIYRARLAGLSKKFAIKTCAKLNSCIIVASNTPRKNGAR